MAYKKNFTAKEKAEYKAKKREEMEALFQKIDDGVQKVFTSDNYKNYLKVMSKFTDYSARNTLLIAMQRPDATLVASFGKWKQFGRNVKKGEHGIEILAPVTYTTEEETERLVLDENGNRQYNDDGTEKKEVVQTERTDIGFKKVYVFDISQTEGKELPTIAHSLTGQYDSQKKAAIIKALEKVTGIEILFADIEGEANGFYSPYEDIIAIKSGMSDIQTLKTAFHETAHKLLHDPKLEIETAKSSKSEKEVQAESTAFIVAEMLGLDTSEYSFPYIASWSDGKQLEQLRNVLDEIHDASKKICDAINEELEKLTQEEAA